MLKKYRIGFDIWGLILFILIMIPTVIWTVKPAPNDILRGESATGTIDMIGSVFQVIFVAAMCIFINKSSGKVRLSPLIAGVIFCAVLYFLGWILYYSGNVSTLTVILLTLPPCLAFIFYSLDRKNMIALVPAAIFTCCHLIYGGVNFIL